MNALYESAPYGVIVFALLTLGVGGAAAMATGRALASTWRPQLHCVLYALPVAATIAFLHYALFAESVIPLYALATAMGAGDVAGFLWGLRGLAVFFVIHAAFALAGFRLTRVRQMGRQYRFACTPAGVWAWRMNDPQAAQDRNSTA